MISEPLNPITAVTHANPYPEAFLVTRENRQIFTFGHGVHACPGARLAVCIAEHAVARALKVNIKPEVLLNNFSYRPLTNGRIPVFGGNNEQRKPRF